MLPLLLLLAVSIALALVVYFFVGPLAQLSASLSLLATLLVYGASLAIGLMLIRRSAQVARNQRLETLEGDVLDIANSLKVLTQDIEQLREQSAQTVERNETVISELKMLQTLLSQVVRRPAAQTGAAVPAVSLPDEQTSAEADGTRALAHNGSGEDRPQPAMDAARLESIIRTALSENRVDLYLQPIVSLPSRKAVHYECFSRVRDEHGDVVFPAQFLPYVEERGLVGTLDNLLLFRCIQLVRRLGRRRPESRFFCNISSSSLQDEEFFPQFIDYMGANAVLADRLVFEFNHDDVQSMSDRVAEPLRKLARRGYRFSLDNVLSKRLDGSALADRGFGWLKVDMGKIDVREGDIAPADYARAMRRNDVHVIATHVEEEDQVLKLLDLNIAYAQGYLFGEPRLSREEPQTVSAGADL